MNPFELLQDLPLVIKITGGLVLLIIARKPTLSYVRTLINKRVSKIEVDHFSLLREEIGSLNKLLLDEQQQKQELVLANTQLMEQVQILTLEVQRLKLKIDQLERRA